MITMTPADEERAEKHRGRRYNYRVDWDTEERLGKVPDAKLARELNVAAAAVYSARKVRGIPPPGRPRPVIKRPPVSRKLTEEVRHLRVKVLTLTSLVETMQRRMTKCIECGAEPGYDCRTTSDHETATHHVRGRTFPCGDQCRACRETFV